MYTVGLSLAGQAELVLVGNHLATGFELINAVGQRVLEGDVAVGESMFVGHSLVRLDDVPDEWLARDPERLAIWHELGSEASEPAFAPLPSVRQVVWTDRAFRFPDDGTCAPEVTRTQPLLAEDWWSYPLPQDAPRRSARHRRFRSR